MADTFNIDGLMYTDKLPHSRIERILYAILKKQGSDGGDTSKSIVVDDPTDVGNGLTISTDSIIIDTTDNVDTNETRPLTSGAVYNQLDLAGQLMQRI